MKGRFGFVWWVSALLVVAGCAGCAEQPLAVPNSDQGFFFADNQYAIAEGWKSDIALVGPQTREMACDRTTGVCGYEHVPLKIVGVRSLDPSVIEVLGEGPLQSALAKGGKVQVRARAEGVASLEAEVEIDGELLRDTFEVRVEEVAQVYLSRTAADPAPFSRYTGCSDEQPGAYVYEDLTKQEIVLSMRKGNAKGEALRGYGVYPLTVEPADGVAFTGYDELQQQLTIQPKQSGKVTLRPQTGGKELVFYFVGEASVDGISPAVFARNQNGQRAQAVRQLVQGQVFDVALFPTVSGAWLCGGDLTVKRSVLTPSNCSLYGDGHSRSEQLILATNPGECRVRFVAERAAGGRGIVFDLKLDVIPGEYAEPGW